MSAQSIETTPCPRCGALMPTSPQFTTWCDQCEYNIDPIKENEEQPSAYERIYSRLNHKLGKSLFEQVKQEKLFKPHLTVGLVLAYVIAALVYLISFGCLALGLWMIYRSPINPMAWIFGGALIGIAYESRPRINKLPESIISRADSPTLFAVTDRLAQVMGSPPFAHIAVDLEANASYARCGLKSESVLTIGAPLLSYLTAGQISSVLAHEMAHGINGDTLRSWFLRTAVSTLFTVSDLIRPETILPSGSIFAYLMVPFLLIMAGISEVLIFIARLLLTLTFRQSQRAEYYADYLEATTAGVANSLSTFDAFEFCHTYYWSLSRAYNNRQIADPIQHFIDSVKSMHPREVERLKRLSLRPTSHLETTHPPTVYRVEMIKKMPINTPSFAVSEDEAEQIRKELSERTKRQMNDLLGRY